MIPRETPPLRAPLLVTLLLLTSQFSALAIDGTWLGTTDANYNTPSNWSAGVVPSPAGTSLFNGAGNGNVNLTNASTTINVIRFDTAAAASYSIGNSSEIITLDSNFAGGVIDMTATVTNSQSVNSALVLGNITGAVPGSSGTYNFFNRTAPGGPSLTVSGNISGYVGGTAGNQTLQLNGPGAGSVSGNISNGGALSLGLTVLSGSWTLSGNNSFTGAGVTIDGVSYTKGVDVGTGATVVLGSNTAVGTNGFLRTTSTTSTIQVGSNDVSLGSGNRFFVSNGTTITGSKNLTINGVTAGNGGGLTLTVNNPKTTLAGDIRARDGTASATGRTMTFNGSGTIAVTGGIQNGSSTGACNVVYNGTGAMLTSGANTYTGTTTVSSGTFLVNGTHSGTTVGGYTVAAGGKLAGTGSISLSGANAVAVTGTLAPGNSTLATGTQTGTFDVTKLTLNTGSTLEVQLGGANPGDGTGFYDQMNVTSTTAGAITLNTGVNLTLSLVNSYTPAVNDTFYFLTRADASTYANPFLGFPEGTPLSLGGGVTGQITYQANWTGSQGTSSFLGGNDVALMITAVPEPGVSTVLLTGLALFTLVLRRPRSR